MPPRSVAPARLNSTDLEPTVGTHFGLVDGREGVAAPRRHLRAMNAPVNRLNGKIQDVLEVSSQQVVTDDEDSADNAASGKLQAAFTSNATIAPLHARVSYPRDLHVRHAITDPENYKDGDPAGPSWNRYWRTLYQESFRFYTTGTMSQENLVRRELDPALPKPACEVCSSALRPSPAATSPAATSARTSDSTIKRLPTGSTASAS